MLALQSITTTTFIELVVKQRDVSHATSLVITHRLQDAFVIARNRFDQKDNKMEEIPNQDIDESTRFLVMNEGKVVFHGNTRALVHSDDPWLKDYIS